MAQTALKPRSPIACGAPTPASTTAPATAPATALATAVAALVPAAQTRQAAIVGAVAAVLAATVAVLLGFPALLASGCQTAPAQPASPPPEAVAQPTPVVQAAPALRDEPLGATPQDFELDVTVLVGRGMPESLRVEDRTARYVVLPDGALHAEDGPYVNQASRPGRARWLYQQQVSDLWDMCRQTGFADASLANGPANPDMLRVARGERLTIVTVRANGTRWSFVRRALGDEPTDPAAARIVRTLAALAWIPDLTAQDIAPDRYDYGADPYAVYRAIRGGAKRP